MSGSTQHSTICTMRTTRLSAREGSAQAVLMGPSSPAMLKPVANASSSLPMAHIQRASWVSLGLRVSS
jgi:hypothetical protein